MILDRVADLVCGDRYGREGPTVVFVGRQAYRFRFRIVVVALVRCLDCNRAKPVGIKQLPRQLPAGARVAIGGQAVTFENPPDPDRRAE